MRSRLYIAAMFWTLASSAGLAQQLAFPEAEGFARFATGARTNLSSATVYHVTNLNNSGAGSFRDAVSQPNRFVVFDVGGIINISSVIEVRSNITIAGQTAPGGITIYGDRLAFHGANNTISRYFAIRKGNAGVRQDSVSIARGSNMMFDHMSVTWGVDETFSMNPDSGQIIDNITIQNTIIAQGLDRLGHSAGGLMTINEGSRFSIIKSLFADNVTRNPKVRGENEFINNVVYGWESAGYIMGDTNSMDSHANAVGNYFIEGPVDGSGPFNSGTARFQIYASDNWVDTNRNGVLDGSLVTSYPGATRVTTPFAFPTTATMTAQQALPYVLDNVGVSVIRDAVDTRIVNEVKSYGTLGGVILRETDLFPNFGTDPQYLNPRARLTDADNDGIADNWETSRGLSPSNAADWKNLNAGYTRLEEYVNELGAAGATRSSAGGTWTTGATWGGIAPTLADTANATGSLTINSGNAFARRLTLAGNIAMTGGTLDVFDTATINSGTATLSGGTATFGRLLVGAPGFSGSLVLTTGGMLQTGTIAANGGTASIDWNGGTIRAAGVPNVSVATTLGTAGGTFDTAAFSGVFSGRITGGGALTKLGAGTLTLSGNNAYTGGTNVTGNLKLTNNNGAGTGPITINSAGGTLQLGNGVTVSNNLVTDFNFEILDVPDANASATFAGNITTNGSRQIRLQTTGAGATLNLTGATNAGSQLFIIKTGNVVLKGNGSISGTGGIVGRSAGNTVLTLQDNANLNIGSFSMGGGQPLTSAVINVNGNASLSTGTGNLDLLATSTTTATSALNLNGGTTTVNGFNKSSVAAGQTSTLSFNGGTLRYGGVAGNAAFLPVLSGLTASIAAGGARIDDNGKAITISQPLLHSTAVAGADGGLTKLGAGSLTLAGANTYNGVTNINAGTLLVNGTHTTGAGYNVLNGGTLGGSGIIGSAVNVSNGGTLAPGNSAGMLTVGSTTLTAGSQLNIELGGTTAGTQFDVLKVNGTLALGGELYILRLNNFAPTLGQTFDILNWTTLNGRFSAIQLLPLSTGLAWNATKLYKTGVLSVVDTNHVPGDFDRDQAVGPSDIQAMLKALTDIEAYKLAKGLSDSHLVAIGDLNADDKFSNADLQGLLDMISNPITIGEIFIVPEPTSAALLLLGGLLTVAVWRKRDLHR